MSLAVIVTVRYTIYVNVRRQKQLADFIEGQRRGRKITRKSEKRRAAMARIDQAFKRAKPADDYLQMLIKQIRKSK